MQKPRQTAPGAPTARGLSGGCRREPCEKFTRRLPRTQDLKAKIAAPVRETITARVMKKLFTAVLVGALFLPGVISGADFEGTMRVKMSSGPETEYSIRNNQLRAATIVDRV